MADYTVNLQTGQKVLDTLTIFEQDGVTPVELANFNVTITSGDVTFEQIGNDGNPLPANQVYILAGLEGTSELEFNVVAVDGRTKISTVEVVVTAAPGELLVVHSFAAPEPILVAKARRR